MTYPNVITEYTTLHLVLSGVSLARYGDGEFALAAGVGIKCQSSRQSLQDRLRAILRHSGNCEVGIPSLRPDGPKAAYWLKASARYERHLVRRQYFSAFISRPDSAPWINTPDYWTALASLWVDEDVTLVRGDSVKALQVSDLIGARLVREIICPRQHAFDDYEAILERIGTPARALLCLGPTATVLAVDLCARGVHAIDLGHVALFLRKYRAGEPMIVTDADKAAA